MTCYAIDGVIPVIDPAAYVHPTAVLIGDVVVGPGCYVGPGASLRGDFGWIELHAGSNVQDNCVAHSFPNCAVIVEENGHIGHGAILHGCRVGRDALIGMHAVIMDDADIGPESIVAACAFVPAGSRFEPRSLIVGTPARVLRKINDDDLARKQEGTAAYHELTRRSLASLVEVAPHTAVAADRKRLRLPELRKLTKSQER
ncbi:MAG: transferase hexapeptide repeat family protein [Rhodanobacter sp.]|jgi:phenylacetic acid degradation protein|nr:transferase hexapeptide repeat family protein [Rhodanobacter sp.]